MKRRVFTSALFGSAALGWLPASRAAETRPVLLTTSEDWQRFAQEMKAKPAPRATLREAATKSLQAKRFSVVDKKSLPPSGDPHDYASLGPYYWPDPAKPDGLPYIQRDGEVNPEYFTADRPRLTGMCEAVTCLILAHHAEVPGAAPAAGRLLRAWFLDAETRMNPNLNFAQAIPGRTTGRGTGIIDTVALGFLLDATQQLPFSSEWTESHYRELVKWVGEYLDWLESSPHGKAEGASANNHGTWFDVQLAKYALFCGRPDAARARLDKVLETRFARQLEPDGRQPLELKRTLSLTYSTFNLLGLVCLATLAQRVGLDLWKWRGAEGRSLLTAVRYHLPFYTGQAEWTGKQIHPFRPSTAALMLHLAARSSGEKDLAAAAATLPCDPWNRLSFYQAAPRSDQDAA